MALGESMFDCLSPNSPLTFAGALRDTALSFLVRSVLIWEQGIATAWWPTEVVKMKWGDSGHLESVWAPACTFGSICFKFCLHQVWEWRFSWCHIFLKHSSSCMVTYFKVKTWTVRVEMPVCLRVCFGMRCFCACSSIACHVRTFAGLCLKGVCVISEDKRIHLSY